MPTGAQDTFGFADSMEKGGGYQAVDMGDAAAQKCARECQYGPDAPANVTKNAAFETPSSAPYIGG